MLWIKVYLRRCLLNFKKLRLNSKLFYHSNPFNQTIMKRLLILILILLGLFSLFFYFSLGSQPKIVGEEETPPTGTELDSTIKNNPIYASYVYVKGAGYVLKDRRIVLLVGQDTAQSRQGDAIKSVEKDLESYWKWQILLGKKNIEDLSPQQNKGENNVAKSRETSKNIFSRILDVFKVADAVNVIRDSAKTCDCDDDLLLLAGQNLHLIETTLNPDGGGIASGVLGEKSDSLNSEKSATYSQVSNGQKAPFLIGVIDSGLNSEPKIDNTNSLNYNFLAHDSNMADPLEHGTKVARIILKNTVSGTVGIVGLKTYDTNSIGNLYDNLCAILYATKHNIKVVNASWGASQKESIPVFEEVMRRAKSANMIVVCSAGNKKEDIDVNPYFPACYADHPVFGSHVVTVTSIDGTVCQNTSSSKTKIDLTYDAVKNCKHEIPDANGNMNLIFETGTSYAAPYVTADIVQKLINSSVGFSKSGYVSSLSPTGKIKKY